MLEKMITRSIRLPWRVSELLEKEARERGLSYSEFLRVVVVGFFDNETFEKIMNVNEGKWVTEEINREVSPDSPKYDLTKPVNWTMLFTNAQLVTFERLKDELVGVWTYEDVAWIGVWIYFYFYGHRRQPKVDSFLPIWKASMSEHPAYQFLTELSQEVSSGDERFVELLTKVEGWIKEGLL